LPKITGNDLNRIHTEFVADPVGQTDRFWSAVRDYVQRCCYLVPDALKMALIQDILFEVFTHIDKFKLGTNFQKWLSAIVRNLRADSFRVNLYEFREIPFSQLGAWEEDGTYAEFEPSTLDGSADEEDIRAIDSESERLTRAIAKLDAIRVVLKKPADRELFDLLRSGLSLRQAAMRLGIKYSAVQRRFARWKEKLVGKCLMASDCEIETVESQKRAA
jgi:RNA polymerase sigma factor (sigma-70 family)